MLLRQTYLLAQLLVKTYEINHKFNCDKNCLAYFLTCKHCGIQYVGQAVADFRYRWNDYKDNCRLVYSCRKHSRNEDCMQKHLCNHYVSCNKLLLLLLLLWSLLLLMPTLM